MSHQETFTARLSKHAHAKARVSSPDIIKPPPTPAPSTHHYQSLVRSCGILFFQSPLELLNFHKDMEEDQTLQSRFITFHKTDRFLMGGRRG